MSAYDEAVALILERADAYTAAFVHGVDSGQSLAGAWSDLVREVCALAGIDADEWAERHGRWLSAAQPTPAPFDPNASS